MTFELAFDASGNHRDRALHHRVAANPLPSVFPVIARYDSRVSEDRTTIAIDRYLVELAGVEGKSSAEPIVGALLTRAVLRLHLLCASLLYRSYPRLTQPPLNLHSDEMLSAVVERLLKALRQVRPRTVRQFFALATQHMRWELNDLARRLDEQTPPVALREDFAANPPSSGSGISAGALRILAAIESLPEDEREVFDLVRIQGMTQAEAAGIIEVSPKTVQRRLNRGLLLLTQKLGDLRPEPSSHGETAHE